MTAILDTSFLFALTDQSDCHHQRVLTVTQNANERLVLPVVVLPEICYLRELQKIKSPKRSFAGVVNTLTFFSVERLNDLYFAIP
jgi:predicted nucleic acid-binding protein